MQAMGLVWKTRSIEINHETNNVEINEATV